MILQTIREKSSCYITGMNRHATLAWYSFPLSSMDAEIGSPSHGLSTVGAAREGSCRAG